MPDLMRTIDQTITELTINKSTNRLNTITEVMSGVAIIASIVMVASAETRIYATDNNSRSDCDNTMTAQFMSTRFDGLTILGHKVTKRRR
jgi:hypothetical protein